MEKQRTTRWRWIAVLVLVVPAVIGLIVMITSSMSSSETVGPVRGLRLGYAPAMARQHLLTGGPGSYATTAMGEDYALTWTADSPNDDLRRARLEFHLGQLVAVRLLVTSDSPEAEGPELQVSTASVLTRESTPEGVEIAWLARELSHARRRSAAASR